ncbi:MAG: dTDP-4-dehydrorhamnose reductase [Candidatus Hydrogenedentes bacterium]|nr:dTDP-4-dehydrorhamnose reductase [Candidatus Hydrogenedentota bacterium]
MRTLIFGSRGQLGRDLMPVFGAEGPVLGCDLPEVDIADAAQVREAVKDFRPDWIVNAAAYTDVEKAEENREAAFRVNELGARTVANASKDAGASIVYFSTDFVFDGASDVPYQPGDRAAPLNVYGASKAAGEAATRVANPRCLIIRTAWLFGPGGNNFVEKILRAAAERPELRVVEDEIGSPTHTLDLAEAALALVRAGVYGVYHAANSGFCSRFEFASAILSQADLDTPLSPCRSDSFPSKVRRPRFSALSSTLVEAVTGYAMRPWRDALSHYLKRRGETA